MYDMYIYVWLGRGYAHRVFDYQPSVEWVKWCEVETLVENMKIQLGITALDLRPPALPAEEEGAWQDLVV